jgi:uncharacterized protein
VSPLARFFRGLIRVYQHVRVGRPSPCRFFPTCSEYALEAIEVHGAFRGSWLALRRLGRCHPWGRHGIDLVPAADPTLPAAPPPGPTHEKVR